MPRKRTTIADTILDYFQNAPLDEARLAAVMAASIVRRREPVAQPAKPKKRMARATLKPATTSSVHTPSLEEQRRTSNAAAPPPPPPNPPVPPARPTPVPPPGRRAPRASRISPAVTPAPPVAQPPAETLEPGDPGMVDQVGDVVE